MVQIRLPTYSKTHLVVFAERKEITMSEPNRIPVELVQLLELLIKNTYTKSELHQAVAAARHKETNNLSTQNIEEEFTRRAEGVDLGDAGAREILAEDAE